MDIIIGVILMVGKLVHNAYKRHKADKYAIAVVQRY